MTYSVLKVPLNPNQPTNHHIWHIELCGWQGFWLPSCVTWPNQWCLRMLSTTRNVPFSFWLCCWLSFFL